MLIQVWPLCLISTSHAREPCLSMITLRIWVFKSDVLKNVIILSKHGTKANIRSTKMANNRHAYNKDVLQSYWTSAVSWGKHTHKPTMWDLPRSGRPWVTSDRDDRALQRLVRRMPFATCPVLKKTCCPIDVCQQKQIETVWNQRDLSQGESLNVHFWQTDIDWHVWHGA